MNGTPLPLPTVRGTLRRNVPLAPLTWLRVGGPAEIVFQPADVEDLSSFLAGLPADVSVLPLGVASNILIRDGGIDGVVIRFGGPFARATVEDGLVIAGCGALDQKVAQTAQRAGRAGLEFMIGIPGTVGGAVRMNAGAFGGETGAGVLWVELMDRKGVLKRVPRDEIEFHYRRSTVPADAIVIHAAFATEAGDPGAILERMEAIKAEREAAQPLRIATGGSTFKNPPGHRAWEVIDRAGCRGLRLGAAAVSEKHCNFLLNTGGATAAEIEALGEMVRRRVKETQQIELEWEIVRMGRPLAMEVAA